MTKENEKVFNFIVILEMQVKIEDTVRLYFTLIRTIKFKIISYIQVW